MTSADDDDLRFSKYLGERYKNLTRIGEGGMGVVYRAIDPMLDIPVAIKILRPERSSVPLLRFQQEARTVAKLRHRNLTRELDCGILPDNSLYIVMEFQEGVSLDQVLARHGRMEAQKALPIFRQIADGIAHAHGLGILHRDLKPSNIIIADPSGDSPTVKIVDFGLAVMMAEPQDESRTNLSGSPLYMAPEASQTKVSDERSDIYSFGCLMMECLTLNPPFRGKTVLDTLLEHRNKQPPLLSERLDADNFPAGLEEVVDKCLCKEPDDRYQSMSALYADLTQIETELIQTLTTPNKALFETKVAEPNSIFLATDVPPKKSDAWMWWVSGVGLALVCLGSLIFVLAPEISSLIDPKEPPTKSKKMDAIAEAGKAIKEDLVDEKFSEMNSYGLWTYNKMAFDDSDFTELAKRTDITRLWLLKSEINGTGLKYLRKNQLFSVAFVDCQVGEKGMEELANFPTITVLRLIREQQLGDNAMRWLLKLPKLNTLYLCMNEKLTNSSMDTLAKIPKLQRLSLQGLTQIDHEGLSKLAGAKGLKCLSLEKTGVGENGLKQLSRFKSLIALDVSGLGVTDEQLKYVALPQIQMLIMRGSKITLPGLKSLRKCKNLRILDVRQCPNITQTEEALRQLLPGVTVFAKGTVEDVDQHSIQEDTLRYEEGAVP